MSANFILNIYNIIVVGRRAAEQLWLLPPIAFMALFIALWRSSLDPAPVARFHARARASDGCGRRGNERGALVRDFSHVSRRLAHERQPM